MAAPSKYYKLVRNRSIHLGWLLRDITIRKNRIIADKKCSDKHELVLVEKKCMPDSTEHVTNVWTMDEGLDIWKKYTKGRLMYDYTGVINPIIHKGDEVYFFDDYIRSKKSAVK